jgi:hypothetical protein
MVAALNCLPPPAPGLGPAVHVALQVGRLQLADRESLAEGGHQVLEMQLDPVDRRLLEGVLVRGQVAVAEVGQRQLPHLVRDRLHVGRRLAVELEEGDDVEAGRQLDQSLLQSHQQVINLCRLGLGLLARDLAEG